MRECRHPVISLKRTRKNDRPCPTPKHHRTKSGARAPEDAPSVGPTAIESELRFERYSNRARLIGRDARNRRLLPREDRIVDGQSGVFVGQISANKDAVQTSLPTPNLKSIKPYDPKVSA